MGHSKPNHTPKKRRGWLISLFILIVLGGGIYWWYSTNKAAQPTAERSTFAAPKVPVRAVPVEQGFLQERIKAIGTVTAFNVVTVRSRVEGELLKIHFQDGQFVEAGEVLAQIDPRSYELRVEQAKGQYKQSKAQLDIATTELRRYQTLYQQDSVARQTLESQEALVAQLEGTVQAAQANIEEAKLQVTYTNIKAPITGKLGFRQLDEGNLISSGSVDGLVTITQTQPIAVTFALPEQQLQQLLERLHLESTLPVEVYDRNNELLGKGELLAVDNQIDIDTGTVQVKASLPNTDNALYPNQFARISVLLGEQEGLMIPEEAIQTGSQGPYVYVVDSENKVAVTPVELGLKSGGRVLVLEGLTEGDQVVTEGTDRLRTGTAVEIIDANNA